MVKERGRSDVRVVSVSALRASPPTRCCFISVLYYHFIFIFIYCYMYYVISKGFSSVVPFAWLLPPGHILALPDGRPPPRVLEDQAQKRFSKSHDGKGPNISARRASRTVSCPRLLRAMQREGQLGKCRQLERLAY